MEAPQYLIAATQLSLLNHKTLFLSLFTLYSISYSSFILYDSPRLAWDLQCYLVGYLVLPIFRPPSPGLSILHYHSSLSCFPYLVNISPFYHLWPPWSENCLLFFLLYWYSAKNVLVMWPSLLGHGWAAVNVGKTQDDIWPSTFSVNVSVKVDITRAYWQAVLPSCWGPGAPHMWGPSHPECWGFLLRKRECRDTSHCPGRDCYFPPPISHCLE